MILNHWKLKLLAVLLAATAWLVSNGRDYTTAPGKKVTLKLQPPPNGVILQVGGRPYSDYLHFSVDLYGPRSKIDMLAGKALTGEYSFSDMNVEDLLDGEVRSVRVSLESVHLTLEDGTSLPPSVEVRNFEPKRIAVKIDRVVSRYMPVECYLETTAEGVRKRITSFPTEDGCADGYQITKFSPSPRLARVLGPATVLKKIVKVRTLPAPVDESSRSLDRKVKIEPYIVHDEYGRVPINCDEEIVIHVEVDELLKSRTLKDIPVQLLTPYKFWLIVEIKTIDGKPADTKNPKVDIDIHGPGVRISEILPQDHVRAVLDVTGAANPGRPLERPLTVFLPDGIRLERPLLVVYEVKPTTAPE